MSIPARAFSICQAMTDPQEDADRFYELLKEAADESPGDDEDKSTVGVNPDPYADPATGAKGNVDARWGEEDGGTKGANTAQHHSNAAWDGFRASREKFLQKNFDSFGTSAENAQAVLGQNLEHFKSGDHESSKPFTNEHSKHNPEVVGTVLDKVKNILGRS